MLLQAQQDEATREDKGSMLKTVGKVAGGIGAIAAAPFTGGASLSAIPLIAGLAEGGKVKMPKAKIATMTKLAKENKLSHGDLTKLDNKKNDVVPAMLSEGEIVVPRSITHSPNAPKAAATFVEALLANKKPKEAKMEALRAAFSKKK